MNDTPTTKTTAATLTAEQVCDRMQQGATLHHGIAPMATRKSWWLMPGYVPVSAAVVKQVRALWPVGERRIELV